MVLVALGGILFAGAKMLSGGDEVGDYKLHTVTTDDLMVTVTEDGNLESASNIDIKNKVSGSTTILKIVADGTVVEEGDELVELDSAAIEEQITQQRIAVNKAHATMVQAQTDFNVAKISKEEYLEGTYKKEIQDGRGADHDC